MSEDKSKFKLETIKCQTCGKMFKDKLDFVIHNKQAHSNQNQQKAQRPVSNSSNTENQKKVQDSNDVQQNQAEDNDKKFDPEFSKQLKLNENEKEFNNFNEQVFEHCLKFIIAIKAFEAESSKQNIQAKMLNSEKQDCTLITLNDLEKHSNNQVIPNIINLFSKQEQVDFEQIDFSKPDPFYILFTIIKEIIKPLKIEFSFEILKLFEKIMEISLKSSQGQIPYSREIYFSHLQDYVDNFKLDQFPILSSEKAYLSFIQNFTDFSFDILKEYFIPIQQQQQYFQQQQPTALQSSIMTNSDLMANYKKDNTMQMKQEDISANGNQNDIQMMQGNEQNNNFNQNFNNSKQFGQISQSNFTNSQFQGSQSKNMMMGSKFNNSINELTSASGYNNFPSTFNQNPENVFSLQQQQIQLKKQQQMGDQDQVQIQENYNKKMSYNSQQQQQQQDFQQMSQQQEEDFKQFQKQQQQYKMMQAYQEQQQQQQQQNSNQSSNKYQMQQQQNQMPVNYNKGQNQNQNQNNYQGSQNHNNQN